MTDYNTPLIERERLLNQGARDYLDGTITIEEWHRIKKLYGPDYMAAARALARRRMTQPPLLPDRKKSLLYYLKKFAKLIL